MEEAAFQWEETSHEEAKEATQAWVARFAPLVMEERVAGVRAIKERLKLVEELEAAAPTIRQRLQSVAHDEDWKLLDTVEKAIAQLPTLEASLRRQIGLAAPGDPSGIADLDKLSDRLAEREARDEMGLGHEPEIPEVLELRTSPSNPAVAAGVGLFGFGWTSFTAVHAVLMIGGMMEALGWYSLFLLGFYAIFFGVGFAMFVAAFDAASEESIRLEGRRLVIQRRIGALLREKRFELARDATAKIGKVHAMKAGQSKSGGRTQAIVLKGVDGRSVSFAAGQPNENLRELVDQINAYLRMKG